jgi:hypothetical protein
MLLGRSDCLDARVLTVRRGTSSSSDESRLSITIGSVTIDTVRAGLGTGCTIGGGLRTGAAALFDLSSSSSELSHVVFLGAGFSAFLTRPKLE